MSRKTRGSLIKPNEITIAHTVAKTARNLFLLGEDLISEGEFLSVVKISTLSGDPQLHSGGFRCSDKGFLDYSDKEYLDALEWCIRNKILEREIKTLPEDIPVCIMEHRFGAEVMIKQAKEFGQMYRYRTECEPKEDQQQACSADGS